MSRCCLQEMTVYQPAEQPIYQVNTIDLAGTAVYHQPHHVQPVQSIIYEPTTIVQQTPSGGVYIPLQPVQEILFTYSAPSIPTSVITQTQPIDTAPVSQDLVSQDSVIHEPVIQEPVIQDPVIQDPVIQDQVSQDQSPLTPPTSDSSDIENNNPNLQTNLRDKEVQTITEPPNVKISATYTYDTLIVTDGRSKNKVKALQNNKTDEIEFGTDPIDSEAPKTGKYVCCECGNYQ